MRKQFVFVGVVVLLLILLGLSSGCVSTSDYDALAHSNSTLLYDYNELQGSYSDLLKENDGLVTKANGLQNRVEELEGMYPLRGFSTVSEFKDWASSHVQRTTTYIDDAFLAAYKVQQAGMEDGYLMGLDIDTDGDTGSVFITVFIGDELYWWFVEDKEAYDGFGLKR